MADTSVKTTRTLASLRAGVPFLGKARFATTGLEGVRILNGDGGGWLVGELL